jgi:hypothetical protein
MAIVVRGKRSEPFAFQLCIENLLMKRAISARNFHIRKKLLLDSSIIYNKG